jgi:hypothetical protein
MVLVRALRFYRQTPGEFEIFPNPRVLGFPQAIVRNLSCFPRAEPMPICPMARPAGGTLEQCSQRFVWNEKR